MQISRSAWLLSKSRRKSRMKQSTASLRLTNQSTGFSPAVVFCVPAYLAAGQEAKEFRQRGLQDLVVATLKRFYQPLRQHALLS